MMKNMIIIDNNLSEQIIICLISQSNEGFTWLWVSKTFTLVDSGSCTPGMYLPRSPVVAPLAGTYHVLWQLHPW